MDMSGSRRSERNDYSKLHSFGTSNEVVNTVMDQIIGEVRGMQKGIDALGSKSVEGAGRELVDTPAARDLADDEVWEHTKRQYEEEVERIHHEVELAQREKYLVDKHQEWVSTKRVLDKLRNKLTKRTKAEKKGHKSKKDRGKKSYENEKERVNTREKIDRWFSANEAQGQEIKNGKAGKKDKRKSVKSKVQKSDSKSSNCTKGVKIIKKPTLASIIEENEEIEDADNEISDCDTHSEHSAEHKSVGANASVLLNIGMDGRDKGDASLNSSKYQTHRPESEYKANDQQLNSDNESEKFADMGKPKPDVRKVKKGKKRYDDMSSSSEDTSSSSSSSESSTSSSASSKTTSSRASKTSKTSNRSSRFYGSDSSSDDESSKSSNSRTGRRRLSYYSKRKNKVKSHNKKGKKASGMYEKANANIVNKVTWAHRGLEYHYCEKSIEFGKISYNQYIAGETKLIAMTEDMDKCHGRLRIMNKIAYAMDDVANSWQLCRAYYAAILVSIEREEERWTSNFRRFDNMLPRKMLVTELTKSKKSDKLRRIPDTVFCKEFNRGACQFSHSHMGKYKEETKRVLLEHICAKCWLKRKDKASHSENSNECPLNKSS